MSSLGQKGPWAPGGSKHAVLVNIPTPPHCACWCHIWQCTTTTEALFATCTSPAARLPDAKPLNVCGDMVPAGDLAPFWHLQTSFIHAL